MVSALWEILFQHLHQLLLVRPFASRSYHAQGQEHSSILRCASSQLVDDQSHSDVVRGLQFRQPLRFDGFPFEGAEEISQQLAVRFGLHHYGERVGTAVEIDSISVDPLYSQWYIPGEYCSQFLRLIFVLDGVARMRFVVVDIQCERVHLRVVAHGERIEVVGVDA